MDNTRTSVHLGAKTRPVFHRPTDLVPMGAIKMGDTTVFPPHDRDQAVEFYRMLITAAAEAVCTLGADEDCVRD